jgi:hypothetical protein
MEILRTKRRRNEMAADVKLTAGKPDSDGKMPITADLTWTGDATAGSAEVTITVNGFPTTDTNAGHSGSKSGYKCGDLNPGDTVKIYVKWPNGKISTDEEKVKAPGAKTASASGSAPATGLAKSKGQATSA